MKPFSTPVLLFFVSIVASTNLSADSLEIPDSVSFQDSLEPGDPTDSRTAVDSAAVMSDGTLSDSLDTIDSPAADSESVLLEADQSAASTSRVDDSVTETTVPEASYHAERSVGVSFESFSSKSKTGIVSRLRRVGAFSRRVVSYVVALPPVAFMLKNALKLGILIASIAVILYTIVYFRGRKDERRFMTTTRLSVMDKEVRRACKHMEKYFDDPNLNLDSLCRSLIAGPAFLEALFQREMGMRVEEFLSHVRINRAREILKKEPAVTVDDLSRNVGISDPGDFEKEFQRLVGVSLEEFRSRTAEYTTR